MLTYDVDSLAESETYKFYPVSDDEKTFFSLTSMGKLKNISNLGSFKNKNTINVETFKCHHTVPCVGYGFSENKQKLKEEYKQLPGKEIAKLRMDGVDIYNTITNYFLVFLGDTSHEVLEDKELLKYSTIMIECTFLLEDDLINAEKTKHMHWNHLGPFVLSHPEITFIVYHFSQRYKGTEIKDFFDKQNYPNVITWISH
jgi:ribonuclease Z